MRDIFQEITDRIAAQLEQGVRPWAKPWTDKAGAFAVDLPHNIDRRPYRGANVFWLWMIGQERGYESPMWMTFNQAKARGGAVRKGEKGTRVFFWKFDKVKDKETGEDKNRVMVKSYTVFNIAQCDDVKLPARAAAVATTEPERIEAADELVETTGATICHGGNQAFYAPSLDRVQMPDRDAFMTVDGYYSTLFHELGHWTGHESRLAREYGKRFGDGAYAFEELVAELTSAFVCASQGFASIERPDHAQYIGHWLKTLKGDPRAFITAAGAAQKAADLILGKAREAEEAEPVAEAA